MNTGRDWSWRGAVQTSDEGRRVWRGESGGIWSPRCRPLSYMLSGGIRTGPRRR